MLLFNRLLNMRKLCKPYLNIKDLLTFIGIFNFKNHAYSSLPCKDKTAYACLFFFDQSFHHAFNVSSNYVQDSFVN